MCQQCISANSKSPAKPAHPHRLIRALAVCIQNHWILQIFIETWLFAAYIWENCFFPLCKYSRLLLSRSPRDSLKYFEISIPRHIRFAELRNKNRTTTFNKSCVIGLFKLEICWKYCGNEEKLLLRSNFSTFPQYFVTCY